MDELLAEAVRRRAGEACEYCLAPQRFYITPFQIEHIIARQHGGPTTFSNLALACLHCNAHKGPNIAGLDPVSRELTRLFNPRRHKWDRHFRWNGPFIFGKTAVGRVTIVVLAMNDPLLVRARREWIAEGSFPPSRRFER
jgi:hypothetical protein